MTYRVSYDPADDVIFLDLTGQMLDHAMIDSIVRDIIAVAQRLDHKVFMLACWQNAGIQPESAEYYAVKGAEILTHLAGAARFGVSEVSTRVQLRAAHTAHKARQGQASNIHETRQQAMAFIKAKRGY